MDTIGRLVFAEALDNWAKSLASNPKSTFEDLTPLLSYATAEAEDEHSALVPLGFLSKTEQLAVLAITKFVCLSKGKFQENLIPLVTMYYELSLEFTWATSNHYSLSYLPVDSFIYSLTKRLLECSDKSWGMQDHIIKSISSILQKLLGLSKEGSKQASYTGTVVLPFINGILRALVGFNVELQVEYSELLIECLLHFESFNGRDIMNVLSKQAIASPDEWEMPFAGDMQLRLTNICNDIVPLAMTCLRDLTLKYGRANPITFQENWMKGCAQLHESIAFAKANADKNPVNMIKLLKKCSESCVAGLQKVSMDSASERQYYVVLLQLYVNVSILLQDNAADHVQKLASFLEEPSKLTKDPFVYQSIIQALGILGQAFKDILWFVNQTFSSLIIGGKFHEITRTENEENKRILRNAMGFNVSKCLKTASNDDEMNQALLHYVNSLSGLENRDEVVAENLVCIIGYLACEYPSDTSSQTVTPLFALLLKEYADTNVASSIMQFLPQLAIGRGFESFVEVIDALNYLCLANSSIKFMDSDISVEAYSKKVGLMRLITEYHMVIARKVKGFDTLNEAYLERLALLFIEKGTEVIKRDEKISKSVFDSVDPNSTTKSTFLVNTHKELIWLLLVIRQCFINYSNDGVFTPKKELLILIRSVWMLAMLIGTDDKGTWFPAWLDSATQTAKKTPLLIRKGSSKLIVADLKTDPIVNTFMKCMSKSMEEKRDRLIKQFFDMNNASLLEEKLLLFLLELYSVESLMFDQPRLYRMYEYLQELYSTDLYDQVKMITEKMIHNFVAKYKHACDNFNWTIINQVTHIILQYPCPIVQVSNIILKDLSVILASFPFVIRNNEVVLDTVFELLHTLFTAYNEEVLGTASYSYVVQGQAVVKNIEITRGLSFRHQLLHKYRDYWSYQLKEVLIKSSDEMVATLQSFLYKFINTTNDKNNVIHAGVSLISELSVSKEACQDLYGISINPLSTKYVSNATRFIGLYGQQLFYRGNIEGERSAFADGGSSDGVVNSIKQELKYLVASAANKVAVADAKLYEIFYKTAGVLITEKKLDNELFSLFCSAPIQIFTTSSVRAASDAWNWFIVSRPDLELRFLNESIEVWEWAIRRSRGIFSHKYNVVSTFNKKMNYGPSPKSQKELEASIQYFLPHLTWIQFLTSHYEKYRGASRDHTAAYLRLVQCTMYRRGQSSNHPIARLCYFKIWLLAWKVIKDRKILDWHREYTMKTRLYELLLGMLGLPAANAYDSKFMANDIDTLLEIFATVKREIAAEAPLNDAVITAIIQNNSVIQYDDDTLVPLESDGASLVSTDKFLIESEREIVLTKIDKIRNIQTISIEVLELELHKLLVWYNPTDKKEKNEIFDDTMFRVRKRYDESFCRPFINSVWNIYPRLAINLAAKGFLPGSASELEKLVAKHAFFCTPFAEAIQFLVRENSLKKNLSALKYLIYWAPVSPVTAVSFFQQSHPYVIQYGLRSLDYYPVELVFFYVPQIVQTLRHDNNGYAEQFIVNTAKLNQLFAHQIIWNMNANKSDNEEAAAQEAANQLATMDSTYDRVTERILRSLSGIDKEFYEREFTFFTKITGISGLLKPYIKRPKNEKKQKIDEELKLIKVDPGVYLPSNPESIVVDIDYKSGRPLQSHAKAPFMATFRIKKAAAPDQATFVGSALDIGETKKQSSYESLFLQDDQNDDINSPEENDENSTWQSAIFKGMLLCYYSDFFSWRRL